MNFSKTGKRSFIGVPATICMVAASFPALAWDPIQDAFTTTSKTNLNFRMRYEDVTDDTKQDTQALTLRSRITYETGKWENLSLLLEMDDVSALLPEDYDDDVNGNTQFSKITDPEGTEVNQAALSYAGVPGTVLKYGRQRITLDNERFIGGVGFRQNEQTYDAFSANNKSIKNLTAFYAYINNVNRIFGEENANGDHEMNTNLANLNYKVGNYGALSGYAYLIDDEAPSAGAYVEGAYSSDTYGVRWAGKVPMGDQALKYNLEYATQSEGANNPVEYDADYGLAEMSFGSDLVSVGVGYEVLGADDGAITKSSGATTSKGFQTPLATLHKFQGWTDQFLGGGSGNIGVGIEDKYAIVQGKIDNYAWSVNYHQYEAAESSVVASLDGLSDLGSEWGVSLDKTWGNYLVGVKYSDYSVGDTDTGFNVDDKSKIWLTMQASF